MFPIVDALSDNVAGWDVPQFDAVMAKCAASFNQLWHLLLVVGNVAHVIASLDVTAGCRHSSGPSR